MQKNFGTEYFKKLKNDKTRLRRWRKAILCLSCVVVFLTVYALILPAITLERKTVCGQEEHSHSAECYSESQELICGKEEHIHTDQCVQNQDDIVLSDSEENVEPAQLAAEDATGNATGNSAENVNEKDAGNVTETGGNSSEEMTAVTQTATAKPEEGAGTPATSTETEYVLSDEANKDKIRSVQLTYKKGEEDKNASTGGTIDTPDNLNMTINVAFADIPVETLKAHNNSFTYQLPEQFRVNDTTTTDIKNGNTVVGTISVDTNGKVVVNYKQDYLDTLSNNPTIEGNFFVSAEFKLSSVSGENGQTIVKTPTGDITIDLGSDYKEHYGTLTVDKQCSKDNQNSDCVKYTITVTAGEGGSKNVYIVDQFTQKKELVNYVGIDKTEKSLAKEENGNNPFETITGNSENASTGTIYLTNEVSAEQKIPGMIASAADVTEPGSFVWKIAEMKAGESRTLTYYVKLKDNNVVSLKNQLIENTAKVFTRKEESSKIYSKGKDEATFTPKFDYEMSKNVIRKNNQEYSKDKNGNYEIEYEIIFNLKENSNYPVKNFEFKDYLDYSDYYTDSKMYQYISYDRTSVQLHVKKANDTGYTVYDNNKITILWAKGNDNYQDWTDTTMNPTRFKVSKLEGNPITINPGDSYYVTYKLKVKPEVYAAMQSGSVTVTNRYLAYVKKGTDEYIIDKVYKPVNLNEYKWVQKTKEEPTTEDTTISIDKLDTYIYDSSRNLQKNSTDSIFKVPAGSYKYTVDINQTQGQFDVTNTVLTDKLSENNIMKYVGYMKITAYDASNYEQGTKWVKINDQTSFSLKLSQIGWNDNNYSYKFEYYAKPVDLNTIGEMQVTNTFKLTETVKKIGSDETFTFNNANSSSTVTLHGFYNLDVTKKAWYYEKPEENAITWVNGQLYWIVEVKGSVIKQGTQIKDAVFGNDDVTYSFIHPDGASIAGVYKGDLGGIENTYKNFAEFEADNSENKQNLEELFELTYNGNASGFHNNSYNNKYNDMFIKAKKDITLGENQTLYIIVRTEPMTLPDTYRKPKTYRNRLFLIDSGKTENEQREVSSVDQKLYYGGDILKELNQTFKYDGKTVQSLSGNDQRIAENLLEKKGGIYASWAFKVNLEGKLKGDYCVLEEIPEGMELAYIRIKWLADQASGVQSKEIENLGTDWEKVENTSTNDREQQQNTIYYVNENKKQALIKLGEFVDGKVDDQYSVDVQVVCRVTDSAVLLGGEQKTFTNKVILQNADRTKDISTATADAVISDTNLTKTNNYAELSSSARQKLTYTITANACGQKLLAKEGGKLTLVDQLGSNLRVDNGSFTAINLKDNSEVIITTKYISTTNTIEIEIPDETPVEITYSVTVDVAPKEEVNVKNDVYWKSYETKGGATNTIENYSYTLSAGGSTGSTEHPGLTIKKIDQDDISKQLNGVVFNIYECELVEGNIKHKDNRKIITGSTASNGSLTVATTEMNFNTIYEVQEISTVEGYILDNTPYYIMCVKQNTDGNYPTEATEYIAYRSKQNKPTQYKVAYNPENFYLDIYNEQKGIVVEKAFINDAAGKSTKSVSGTYKFGLYTIVDGNKKLIDTDTITYNANDTEVKSIKFKNPAENGPYYVFELDDNDQPIDASTEVTINNLQYKVTYTNNNTASNEAKIGDTVTVTNQSYTKKLPSTGSCGVLIYRLAGAILILFAVVLMLIRYKETKVRKN